MRRAVIVTLPLAVVLALTLWRAEGPPPRDGNAPANAFSAIRAKSALGEVLAEGVPHPVGSPENIRVRERLETRFRSLGYETSIQRRFACNGNAQCAMVENLLARTPGASGGDTILLTAHYDSVAAGPGASDDGMGVATLLEVARAIRGQRMTNRVAFLLTDGEEAGLLGAEAFVADEQLMRDVAVVVNFEMRGTRGASNLFETSKGNRWILRHLAGELERPQASSLFYAIYTLLPNDTDVTVFKREGKAAINFAAIGGVNWYHTPLDDLAHASPRTLQHHGDHALATLRALGDVDLAARSRTDATYFDVLQFFVIWWPQEWTLWIAIVSLILLVFAVRKTAPRSMTFGVLATFAAIFLSSLGGTLMRLLVRLRSADVSWVAHPLAPVAAMVLTGIAMAFFAAAMLNRRNDARGMLYGAAIVWHVIGIALAVMLPGAAYLMIVPAAAVTICALAKRDETVTSAVATTVAAIVMFPIVIMLYEALGAGLMTSVAVVIGIFMTLVAPLFPHARNGVVAIALALVCAVIALAQSPYSEEKPRTLSLYYLDDSFSPQPLWLTYDVTPEIAKAATFGKVDPKLTPWNRGDALVAPAPSLKLPRVLLSSEKTPRGYTIRATSQRNAGRISLFVRGGTIVRTNGVTPPPITRHRGQLANGWSVTSGMGVQELVVDVETMGRIEVIGSDATFGFPREGEALLKARAASTAMPLQDGDVSITRTRSAF